MPFEKTLKIIRDFETCFNEGFDDNKFSPRGLPKEFTTEEKERLKKLIWKEGKKDYLEPIFPKFESQFIQDLNDLIDSETFFHFCPLKIYSSNYNERLDTFRSEASRNGHLQRIEYIKRVASKK